MHTLQPTLDTLPCHLLQQVADTADEQSVWAAMRTCRALRKAGEKALQPYLAEKVITAEPSFLINTFESIPPTYDQSLEDRLESLRDRSDLFTDHLIAYPKSETCLKRLTVEVRGQDDWETKSGWNHLQKLFPQLERLEIHVIEPLRIIGGDEETDEDSCSSQAYRREEEREDIGFTWDSIVGGWSKVIDKRTFPNLTNLSIHTTARVLEHLDQVAKCVPNLRHLTLGAHWANSDLLGDRTELDELYNIPELAKLESITIVGGEQTVLDALSILLLSPHTIRHVTICLLNLPEPTWGTTCPLLPSGAPVEIPRIEALALYGPAAFEMFTTVLHPQKDVRLHATFHHITTLILERDPEVLVVDRDPKEAKVRALYPLLNDETSNQPLLPSLRRISWIDRGKDQAGAYILGTLDPTGTSEFYTTKSLRALLHRYPSLAQVQFIAGYPVDPFLADDPSTWAERNVKCVVNRPGSPKSPFEPLLPPTYRPRA